MGENCRAGDRQTILDNRRRRQPNLRWEVTELGRLRSGHVWGTVERHLGVTRDEMADERR